MIKMKKKIFLFFILNLFKNDVTLCLTFNVGQKKAQEQ